MKDRATTHLLHAAKDTGLGNIGHVDEDVVCGVAVERSAEALLVKVVADETDGATEDEQAVQGTDLDVFISFLGSEGTAIPEEIDETYGDATIDVQNELREGQGWIETSRVETHCVLLRGGHLLDGKGIIEQAMTGEVLVNILLDKLDTEIRVVDALDLVADTRD